MDHGGSLYRGKIVLSDTEIKADCIELIFFGNVVAICFAKNCNFPSSFKLVPKNVSKFGYSGLNSRLFANCPLPIPDFIYPVIGAG